LSVRRFVNIEIVQLPVQKDTRSHWYRLYFRSFGMDRPGPKLTRTYNFASPDGQDIAKKALHSAKAGAALGNA
jgi:hypothetical protein